MARRVLGPPECLVPVASEEGDLGEHCRRKAAEAERSGHFQVALGPRLTDIEGGVADELIVPEANGVRDLGDESMTKARCQRDGLLAQLGRQLQPAEFDRGKFHQGEDHTRLPQVAPGPQQACSFPAGLKHLLFQAEGETVIGPGDERVPDRAFVAQTLGEGKGFVDERRSGFERRHVSAGQAGPGEHLSPLSGFPVAQRSQSASASFMASRSRFM